MEPGIHKRVLIQAMGNMKSIISLALAFLLEVNKIRSNLLQSPIRQIEFIFQFSGLLEWVRSNQNQFFIVSYIQLKNNLFMTHQYLLFTFFIFNFISIHNYKQSANYFKFTYPMPPKFYSKTKRNYSNAHSETQLKSGNRINIIFLLINNNKIGIDVPYKVISNDSDLKNIIKKYQGLWDKDQRMWILSHKNYQKLLDEMLDYCKKKQYFCSKIPSFVYDAQLDMPLDLFVKVYKIHDPPLIRYIDIEKHIDPETLPFYDKLYDFQKQSLKFGIQHHGRLLLADEMGVGKTLQSLALAFIYRFQWPLVIICPSTLRFNWQNQVLNWYGQYIKKNEIQVYMKGGSTLKETTKVLIVSYDLAWKFKQLWTDFKVAIVDQAHYLKNSGCKRTDILVPQLSKKKRIILLTGTPAFARPRQIFNLASIIRPDVYYNFKQFGDRYCDPSRNPWSGGIQYNGCVNSKQLFYLLKNKIMLRRLKKDVLTQLPDKQRQKIIIQANKNIIKQISNLIQKDGKTIKSSQDVIMSMFGVKNTDDHDHQDQRKSLMQAYRLSGAAKVQGVVQYILSLLQNDVKLLIFAHHRAILDRLENELNKNKFKTIRIDGQVDMASRQQRVDSFQNNKDIMAALLSISAAGVGLTMTASSTVVFAELHWTPGMLIQAQDRAHRIGQKNCVNCHYLIGQGTLDSILYNYLLKKINNVSTFVDGTQKRLQIQQLSKGELGKVSKSGPSFYKQMAQFQNEKKSSFTINPIRIPLQIRIEHHQCSQNTDISSQTAVEKKQDEQTGSLKSGKRFALPIFDQQTIQQQIPGKIRANHKLKVFTGRVVQKIKESESGDSLRTSDIINFMEEFESMRKSGLKIAYDNYNSEEKQIKKSVQMKTQQWGSCNFGKINGVDLQKNQIE